MSTPQISLLAGLVHGYTSAKDEMLHEDLKARTAQRDAMVQYLGHLASSPNIPPEHQQWALGKVQELIQADPSKKLPKVDLGELPAVQVNQPPRQATPTLPGMTIRAPQPPGGASGATAAPATPPSASNDVGRASDGTVNALGAARPAGYTGEMPIAPVRVGDEGPTNAPGTIVAGADAKGRPTLVPNQPNFSIAQPKPLEFPAERQATIQNPQPPTPVSAKGELHVLTPQDRAAYAEAASRASINRLQQQYPDKSPEDLAYFSQHGEFPKDEYTLTPGEKRYKDGKVVAENKEQKPGAKAGYEPKMGPGGPIGVIDVSTGGMLSPQQVADNPQAKAVLDQAQGEYTRQQEAIDTRDTKKIDAAAEAAQKAADRSQHRQVTALATDGAKKAKPMIDLLDTQTAYMDEISKGGEPTARKDLALVVAAVRAMNPGTVRLPQKELELEIKAGSWGDRARRWFDNATEGTLPSDQRLDLFRVVHDETTRTATSAAQDWKQAFAGSKDEEPPSYLKRFLEEEQSAAPEGASHEVLGPDGKTVIGHVVNNKFVPLGSK